MNYSMFLTCPRGFEEICENELVNLGIKDVIIKPGGVFFEGNKKDIYLVNYMKINF